MAAIGAPQGGEVVDSEAESRRYLLVRDFALRKSWTSDALEWPDCHIWPQLQYNEKAEMKKKSDTQTQKKGYIYIFLFIFKKISIIIQFMTGSLKLP